MADVDGLLVEVRELNTKLERLFGILGEEGRTTRDLLIANSKITNEKIDDVRAEVALLRARADGHDQKLEQHDRAHRDTHQRLTALEAARPKPKRKARK